MRNISSCIYCGEKNAGTMDHIPPDNLFPKPKPANLITVPCCEQCRKTQPKDDEYFRIAIVAAASFGKSKSREEVNNTVIRSLGRKEAALFSKSVIDSLVEIKNPTAIEPDNFTPGIKIDQARFDRVLKRIICGLLYNELRRPLPTTHSVSIKFNQLGFGKIDKKIEEKIDSFGELKEIGNGIFSYRYWQATEDPLSTMWLLTFYECVPAIGFTYRK